ncbi:Hypothetical predicted protein [Scomber scombrus]|uniref:Uncharacterized protein n=1 Tax=Scomber scombrus TaxID=13677 RepID=A0AAV1PXU4_SCOSC
MLTQKNKHSEEQPDQSATEVTKNKQGNKAKTQRSDLFSTAPSAIERPAPVTRHTQKVQTRDLSLKTQDSSRSHGAPSVRRRRRAHCGALPGPQCACKVSKLNTGSPMQLKYWRLRLNQRSGAAPDVNQNAGAFLDPLGALGKKDHGAPLNNDE